MELISHSKAKGSHKGVLLTLLTIVIFILMLGEVITYVVLNINYDNLSSAVAQSLASGNFAQSINLGISAFLYSGLGKALNSFTYFEASPAQRNDRFVNNTQGLLEGMLYNGSFYENESYFNSSLEKSISEFRLEALTEGFTANLSNITLSVKMASPFAIGADVRGFAALNTSSGITLDYPIDTNATIVLSSMPSLIAAEQGFNSSLQGAVLPNATIVGNISAERGSTGPLMFAYGTVVYVKGEPTCTDISSNYRNGNFILATPNAEYIGQYVCGMAGLVTNISNSSTPLRPYLVYSNSTIMQYLNTSPRLLIDGPALELLNTSKIQSAAESGFYYASPYAASFFQRAQGEPYKRSRNGIFTFGAEARQVAYFSGSGNIITPLSLSTDNFTVALWVRPQSLAKITSTDGYSLINTQGTNPFELLLNSGFGQNAKADSGDEEVGIGASTYHAYGIGNSTWSFLAVAVSNGIATIYANGEPPYTVNSIPAGPYSLDDLALGQAALGIGPYNGSMANVQIYNSTLSSAQVGSLYLQGIDAIPASRSRLVEWFPLYTNSKDYSGMNNNGTSTGVGYSNIQNYYVNPTGQQMQNFVSKTAFFNGTDSMITLPISVANGSDITMTGWIYLNNVPSTDEGIFSFTSNSNNGTIAVFFKGDCNVEAGVTNTIGAWQGSTGAECLLPDRWYQIAAEANQGSGSYSLYIDGMKQFSAAFTGTLEGSNSIDVGLFSPKSAYFSGLMGNLQFYGTQLSQGELTALYREGLHGGPLNVSELYGFYPLDGNANDYSGNGNNGASYGLNYEPMELPLSTSPIEGVFGCYNTVLCNSTGQRLFVSGLPLENANIGYANMSGSLGMEYGMMPDALHLNGIAYALAHIGSYFGYKNNITASVWAYIAPGYSGPLVAVSGNSGTEALIREQGMKVIGPASNVTLSHPGWYNFIASYSAVNNEAAFYVNGSEIGSPSGITYTAPGQFPYWTTTISSGTLNGTIEDLQIYKSYVSSAQAAQLYMNNSVFGLAPAEYLPLGAGNAGMQNETVNLANYSDYAIMYSAPGFICTNNHFDYGSCGVEYVPG